MTNQEAIDLLDNLIGMIEDNHGSDYDSAIRMAINALKNQPELANNSKELENKNGELISRQKAKDAIDMALDHIDHVPPWVYDKLLNALNEVPSVQPRKGKWILDNPRSDDSLIYIYACSECHAHHRARYDFCPSCGSYNGGDSDDS